MDFSKIKNFDSHIDKSIPGYSVLSSTFKAIAEEYMFGSSTENGVMIDMGCTTGAFLSSLKKVIGGTYKGIDIAKHPDMIPGVEGGYSFEHGDILHKMRHQKRATVISSMFMLQFIGGGKRREVLKELKRLVDGGAVLLCSEKTHLHDSRLNSSIHRCHLGHKRAHFSDTEILDKEETMQGQMQYLDHNEFMSEMCEIGEVSIVWASLGFVGVVVKSKSSWC